MFNAKSKKILIFGLISTVLVSCGGSGGGSAAGNSNPIFQPPPELKEWTVTGTSPSVNKVIQLDSSESINFSSFVKIRTVDSGQKKGFSVKLYLSLDSKFDNSDPEIFHSLCRGDKCDGYNTFPIRCEFGSFSLTTNKMQFYCDTNTANGLATIDNRFLDVLPKKAYILLFLSGFNSINDYRIYSKEVLINN